MVDNIPWYIAVPLGLTLMVIWFGMVWADKKKDRDITK